MGNMSVRFFPVAALMATAALTSSLAQSPVAPAALLPRTVIFERVRIFDGKANALSAPSYVLVQGNLIKSVSGVPIPDPAGSEVVRINGDGRTLMPGMIDAHTHLMFATVPQVALLTSDISYITVAAAKGAHEMLMRGFTTARDVGGPVFGLKRGIDQGLAIGPRIFPSGAFISQSGGHGDFRMPTEFPAGHVDIPYPERVNAAVIADSPDEVRKRAREQLALGASQIKMMAGGGVSSSFDPLDVTQYTVAELRAGVEAAANWGTYVAVHAYTPKAVQQAIEAGVQCIEHGNLLDDATVKQMAQKGIWWSLQPFLDDQDATPFPEGSPNRAKQLEMTAGTDTAYKLAKKYKVKTAWGSDTLFDAKLAARQGQQLTKLTRWYTSAEVLRMATSDNAELLALSGLRSPYPGILGVVQAGALADLLLLDGDPLQDIHLIDDPDKNLLVIMKDGKIYKNKS